MRRVRSHIGILAVVMLVTSLGGSVTVLAGMCCPAESAAHGCSHHGAGMRTVPSSDAPHPVTCPMHKDVTSPESRDTQSDGTLVCGCTNDPETAVFDTFGLLALTTTVAPPHVAVAVAHVLLSLPAQRPRLPALPPPRVRPA
jgi:hypothetical protein